MTWFKVDDGFSSSRKLMRIPRATRLAAAGLWVIAGSWSAREELDGLVPDYMLAEWDAPTELVEALVEADLWLRVDTDDASAFVNWTEYQPTREEQEGKREAERARKAAWRAAKRAKASGKVPSLSQRDSDGTSRDILGQQSGAALGQKKRLGTDGGLTLDAQVTDASVPWVSQRDIPFPRLNDVSADHVHELSQRDNNGTDASVTAESAPRPLYPDPTRPDPYKGGGSGGDVTSRAGKASPLQGRCRQHENDETPPPCGACADARRTLEAAEQRYAAEAAQRRRYERDQAAAHRRAEIDSCSLCDDAGYRGTRVCDHDPTAEDRAARGIEQIREALARKGIA